MNQYGSVYRYPHFSDVKRWVAQLREESNKAANAAQNIVGTLRNIRYELPAGAPDVPMRRRFNQPSAPGKDAVDTLRYLKHAGNLKDLSKADESLVDAIAAACGEEFELADRVYDNKPQQYKRSQLYHARRKLDAVGMLVERRELKDLCRNRPDELVSAHLFTDASPVTKSELQGMILELCMACGAILVFVMPGVMMHYGSNSVFDKALAFIWALHLMLGTDVGDLKWLCGKIGSVTTDMGTELGFIDVPDLIQAFILRRQGVPMDDLAATIDPSSRLVPNALRVPGWSHIFGNLMKSAGKGFQRWPEKLTAMRTLSKFFRNDTWVKEVIRKLKDVYPDVVTLLKGGFKASFIKWRYETLFKVVEALLKLRFLCQNHLIHAAALFGDNNQDKELMDDFQNACRWVDLWVWMKVFFARELEPLEGTRRWGLVCACCKPLRDLGRKSLRCPQSSRRLHQARERSVALIYTLNEGGRELNLNECEDLPWLVRSMSYSQRKLAQELQGKSRFLFVVPWRVAEADDPPASTHLCRTLAVIRFRNLWSA
jgi:hypothetical protein